MAIRITDIARDLPRLNAELERIDSLEAQFKKFAAKANQNHALLTAPGLQGDFSAINNLLVTWTGGTLTLSWPSAYTQDTALNKTPILAGSRVVAASSFYWFGWDPHQQQMLIFTDLSKIATPSTIPICQVKTGTGGQAGTAGGGGSDPGGLGPNGKIYANF